LKPLQQPLVACWPVLTEAAWLLRHDVRQVVALMRFCSQGVVAVEELGVDAPDWIAEFFQRYPNREPQLADAALMYLAEREGIETVFTLDRRDFSIYRTSDGRALTIIPQ
jgi:predicted nucleic acid-binding protein